MNIIRVSDEEMKNIELEKFKYVDDFIFDEVVFEFWKTKFEVDIKRGNKEFNLMGYLKPTLRLTIFYDKDNLNEVRYLQPYKDGWTISPCTKENGLPRELLANSVINNIKLVIFYIMTASREKKHIISSHQYNYSREYKLSTTNKKIFLLDDIVNYVSEKYVPEGGHREIMCPCWEVRGHYRHLKSGKVIFIRPFKKGKERTTAEPKAHEYYLDKSMQ